MTPERYAALTADENGALTEAEKGAGYHFCPDWDFLLIGPGFAELEGCCCQDNIYNKGHP